MKGADQQLSGAGKRDWSPGRRRGLDDRFCAPGQHEHHGEGRQGLDQQVQEIQIDSIGLLEILQEQD